MKSLFAVVGLTSLMILIAQLETAERRTERDSTAIGTANEFLDLWKEYVKTCYADSVLEFETEQESWVPAHVWRSYYHQLRPKVVDYRWYHRQPTLEGFIRFLESIAHERREKEELRRMKELAEQLRKRLEEIRK